MLIEARGLRFLNKIEYPDINLEEGYVYFLQGESGVGKSTFFKLLNRTIEPNAGVIMYSGKDTRNYDSIELRRKLLLVGQEAYLFKGSIESNFDEYYSYIDKPKLTVEEKTKFLNICCLDYDIDNSSDTLSGGEKQRVFLAIALSLSPSVIMLDEPTSALDSNTAHRLMSNLAAFIKENKISLLVISHDKGLVADFSDKVITLTKKAIYE